MLITDINVMIETYCFANIKIINHFKYYFNLIAFISFYIFINPLTLFT